MSAWGCVGRFGAAYVRHLDIGLARRMMKEGSKLPGSEGGAYGAATAFNKWSRGYNPNGSTWKDTLARRGTLYGAGALAGAAGGGLINNAMMKRRKARMGNYISSGDD